MALLGGRGPFFGQAELGQAPGIRLAGDVRLDARVSLSRELGRAGSDHELALAAFVRWGEQGIQRLIGAFAFAIWDRSASRMLLARDHLGFRSLHYWRGREGVVFGSTADAVRAWPEVSSQPDELAILAEVVSNYAVLKERSFYSGIAKVPPAETLALAPDGRPVRSRYWSPHGVGTNADLAPADCAAALREVVAEACGAAVEGSAVASHLSGGADSGVVTAGAQQALRRRGAGLMHAYSWSPPPDRAGERPDDERRRAADLARTLGLALSWIEFDEQDLQADFERDVALLPNESTQYEYRVLQDAQARGVNTILSGWGGDDVASFNGRGILSRLAAERRWRSFVKSAVAGARRRGKSGLGVSTYVASNFAHLVLKPRLPAPVRSRLGGPQAALVNWAAIHPDAPALYHEARAREATRPYPRDTQIAYLEAGHITARLESWAYAGAQYGIEHRYPLLDRRVIDLCLRFPPDVWLNEGQERWVFRAAFKDWLPGFDWDAAKHEPMRVNRLVDLAVDRWEPHVRPDMPPHAQMLAEFRRRLRAEIAAARL